MKTEIEAAIKKLLEKLPGDNKGDEAMKLTQAALNLAHVVATLDCINKQVA